MIILACYPWWVLLIIIIIKSIKIVYSYVLMSSDFTLFLFVITAVISYRISGYLHEVQLSRMSSIYHEPVIFTDALFATRHFFAGV